MALLPTSIAAIVEAITESVCLREVVLGPVEEFIVNSVEGGKLEEPRFPKSEMLQDY